MGSILIKNGSVWDGHSFSFQDILTCESRIAQMGRSVTADADFVFDADGKIVSAGLVDMHTHMRGVSSESFGISGEMSCFPFGVTAACDAGAVGGNKQYLQSLMLKSVVFPCVEIQNNHAHFTCTEQLLEEYKDKSIGIKVFFDVSSHHVVDITPLEEACAYARQKNLKVMVHCSNSPVPMAQIIETLDAGDILTHVFHGGANSATADDFYCLKLARSKGVILDAGFAGHIHMDFKVFHAAVAQGILPDTISTDITKYSAYKRGGRYGMTMCMSMAKQLGMDETDIFRSVTSAPANVLGQDWGHLAVGKTADITVLELSDEGFDLTDKAGNRIRSEVGYRCVLTVSDGEIIYRR